MCDYKFGVVSRFCTQTVLFFVGRNMFLEVMTR